MDLFDGPDVSEVFKISPITVMGKKNAKLAHHVDVLINTLVCFAFDI